MSASWFFVSTYLIWICAPNFLLHGMKLEHNQRSPSVKTVLPRMVRQDICEGWRFTPLCDTTCRDHSAQPTTQRKTLRMPSRASVSISVPTRGRQRAQGGRVLPVLRPVQTGTRIPRLLRSTGPLSMATTTSRHRLPFTSSG